MAGNTISTLLKPGFWDLLTGLPAGLLIFMSTVLFSTLASVNTDLPIYLPLAILGLMAFITGVLAGITRLRRGPATGLMASIVTASILAYLMFAARPGDTYNPLVIGVPGIIVTVGLTPLGGWTGARIRKVL